MITLKRFRRIERALEEAGYVADNAWAEQLRPPVDADQFAEAAVYVIVNSGMQYSVAQDIFGRCIEALWARGSARRVFGHVGKVRAIDQIWKHRKELFDAYRLANDKLEFCQSLPWIGPGLRSNDAENRSDLLRAQRRIILVLQRFANSAGFFPLGGDDEFALVQHVLAVIVDNMEGHYVRSPGEDFCLVVSGMSILVPLSSEDDAFRMS